MEIKPIKTEAHYAAALRIIEQLFEAEPDTPEGDLLEVWVTLVEAYEAQHYAIALPDPIEALKYHIERLHLASQDLAMYFGSQTHAIEVLNRKRRLTLKMIRKLQAGMGISAEVLIQPYPLVIETPRPHPMSVALMTGIR